jgi:hypothetical protein
MTESILSRNRYLIALRITNIEPSQYTTKFRGKCLNINSEGSTGSSGKALFTTVNEKTGNHGQALFTIVHVKPVNEDTNDKVLLTALYVKPPVKTIKIVIR